MTPSEARWKETAISQVGRGGGVGLGGRGGGFLMAKVTLLATKMMAKASITEELLSILVSFKRASLFSHRLSNGSASRSTLKR